MARLLKPPLEWKRHLYAFCVGTAAGATVGTVGWGGAQVIIPSLTLPVPAIANLSQLSATGVSLTSLSLSTITTGFKFWKEERVDIPIVLLIGIPAVLSARLGTRWARQLSGDALALFFNGFSIVLIPTHFWIQERAKRRRSKSSSAANEGKQMFATDYKDYPTRLVLQHASFGLVSGVVSSLMGVGGLPLPMSYLTEATNLHHHHVQGTAICAVVPSILTSAASRMASIPFATASLVCLGAIAGGYTGAKFALSLDEEQLRNLYMASLVMFGGRSVYGASRNIRAILARR